MDLAARSSMAAEHETCPRDITRWDGSVKTKAILGHEQAKKESIEGNASSFSPLQASSSSS